MKHWLQPTLVRRVKAMLVSFTLIWVVLIGIQYFDYSGTDRQDQELAGFGADLVSTLSTVDRQDEVIAVVAATASQANKMHRRNNVPVTMLIQVRDLNDKLLFASDKSGDKVLHGEIGLISGTEFSGQAFRVYRGDTARWSVLIGRSLYPKAWVLQQITSDLTYYILISLVIALLPMWTIVVHELRPLREVSRAISNRSADDLSPTGLDPVFAELKPLVRSLDDLLGQLRNKVDRENAFVHEAAHELRTPMAVVSAQAHALVHAKLPEERIKAELQLDQAIARSSHLVEQLLQLAKVDSKWKIPEAQVDLAQEVRQAMALLAMDAINKGIDLSLDAPDVAYRTLDINAFRSIVHNLIGNAILYVPADAKIVVGLETSDAMLKLTVADNGPGIPVSQRELVFERFYRGTGHDVAGSGLGLAIVKQACTKLGGQVWIEDGIDGQGCKFVVSLPRQVPARS